MFHPLFDVEAIEIPLPPRMMIALQEAEAWANLLGVQLRIIQQPGAVVLLLSKPDKIAESYRVDEMVDPTAYVKKYAEQARPWVRN